EINGDVQGSGGVNSGQISCAGTITSVMVGRTVLGGAGLESGEIKAANIGPVQIGGDLRGGDGRASGLINATTGNLGNVMVGGSVIGMGFNSGVIFSEGNLGRVQVTGDVRGGTGTLSGRIFNNTGSIAGITIHGSLVGTLDNSGLISSATDI